MLASERYEEIIQIVNEKGYVSTKDLADRFNVTEMTIRRDCDYLDKHHLAIKVHGGIKSLKKGSLLTNNNDIFMDDRLSIHAESKRKVCQKAAELIHDGDCIYLDGGTSILPILDFIKDKKVIIVTPSFMLAQNFNLEQSELFFIGGKYSPKYKMSLGPVALDHLERFNFTSSFIACSGLDIEKGVIYTTEIDTMALKQKVLQQSEKNYLLVDDSKLSIKGFCSLISLNQFDLILCNESDSIDLDTLPSNFILT